MKALGLYCCQIDEFSLSFYLLTLPNLEALSLKCSKLTLVLLSELVKLEQLQELTFDSTISSDFCLSLIQKFRYDDKYLLEGKSDEELKNYWNRKNDFQLRQKQFTSYPDEF